MRRTPNLCNSQIVCSNRIPSRLLSKVGNFGFICQGRARREAMVETGLSENNLAIACPFSVNDILDLDFYANADE
jgi:hypothetical protein